MNFHKTILCIHCFDTGRVGMSSLTSSTLGDLIGVMYSDYGSLRIKREPVKRHGELRGAIQAVP